MADPDVFFHLTADSDSASARTIIKLRHNQPWFHAGTDEIAAQPLITSRESTPGVPEPVQAVPPVPERLVLTFSRLFSLLNAKEIPDLRRGISFGTDPRRCHILLGHRGTLAVSGTHYTVAIDDTLRVRLRDGSKHGTAVECNRQNREEKRKNDYWTLTMVPGLGRLFDTTTIHTSSIALTVEFPNHANPSSEYLQNLKKFDQLCKEAAEREVNAAPAVDGLTLTSGPSTAAPSGAVTPGTLPIYYKTGKLGKGQFGTVYHVIRARDARYFAAKIFDDITKKRSRGESVSAKEACIQREFKFSSDFPHDNIIKALELRNMPELTMIMEFYPSGSMASAAAHMNEIRYVTAFGQILCGLAHLHKHGIVHRDLKPENFLVQLQPWFKVVIADFGLAKTIPQNALLNTFCGTPLYLAPEVCPGVSVRGYDSSADIWSLGAIAYEWLYDCPEPPPTPARWTLPASRRWVVQRCNSLQRSLDNEDDDPMVEMLTRMIENRPHERWSATQLLHHGLLDESLFKRRQADGLIVCARDPVDHVPKDIGADSVSTDGDTSKHIQTPASAAATIIQRSTTSHQSTPIAPHISASADDPVLAAGEHHSAHPHLTGSEESRRSRIVVASPTTPEAPQRGPTASTALSVGS